MPSTNSIPSKARRRPKRGRPTLPEDLRLDARISTACTRDQADRIKAAAAARGLTTSQFLLAVALDDKFQVPAISVEWRHAWAGLALPASNLQQLIRHLDSRVASTEVEDAATCDKLRVVVLKLAHQISQLRKALVPTQ